MRKKQWINTKTAVRNAVILLAHAERIEVRFGFGYHYTPHPNPHLKEEREICYVPSLCEQDHLLEKISSFLSRKKYTTFPLPSQRRPPYPILSSPFTRERIKVRV
jgi:hypothetical protein